LSKAHIPARQRKGTFFSVSPGGFASKGSVGNPRAFAGLGERIEIGAPIENPKADFLKRRKQT
jgi:hypothetical protein